MAPLEVRVGGALLILLCPVVSTVPLRAGLKSPKESSFEREWLFPSQIMDGPGDIDITETTRKSDSDLGPGLYLNSKERGERKGMQKELQVGERSEGEELKDELDP